MITLEVGSRLETEKKLRFVRIPAHRGSSNLSLVVGSLTPSGNTSAARAWSAATKSASQAPSWTAPILTSDNIHMKCRAIAAPLPRDFEAAGIPGPHHDHRNTSHAAADGLSSQHDWATTAAKVPCRITVAILCQSIKIGVGSLHMHQLSICSSDRPLTSAVAAG
jgi:hypothetical protein